jgi:hypothetical protein
MAEIDAYAIAIAKRRQAELDAHLAVLTAQQALIEMYQQEREEIESFLEAYDNGEISD